MLAPPCQRKENRLRSGIESVPRRKRYLGFHGRSEGVSPPSEQYHRPGEKLPSIAIGPRRGGAVLPRACLRRVFLPRRPAGSRCRGPPGSRLEHSALSGNATPVSQRRRTTRPTRHVSVRLPKIYRDCALSPGSKSFQRAEVVVGAPEWRSCDTEFPSSRTWSETNER